MIIFVTLQFKTEEAETVFLNPANKFKSEFILIPVVNNFDGYFLEALPENVRLVKNKINISLNPAGIFRTIIFARKIRKELGLTNIDGAAKSELLYFMSALMDFALLKKCKELIFVFDTQKDILMKLKQAKNFVSAKSFKIY